LEDLICNFHQKILGCSI